MIKHYNGCTTFVKPLGDNYQRKDIMQLIDFCQSTFDLNCNEKILKLKEMNEIEYFTSLYHPYNFEKLDFIIKHNSCILSFMTGTDEITLEIITDFIKNNTTRENVIISFILINFLRRNISEERECLKKIVMGQSYFYNYSL